MSADKTVGEQKEGQPRRSLFAPQKKTDPKTTRSVTSTGKARVLNTPTRKPVKDNEEEPKQVQPEGSIVTRTTTGLRDYFEGVRSELRKVTWPDREDTRRLTIIVLVALVATAILLGTIVLIFTQLFAAGLDNPVILIVFMLVAAAVGVAINRMQNRPSGFQR